MRIKQAHISPVLNHFAKDFYSYWNLEPYSDPNKPALFFGLYTRGDKQLFAFHKGFKLLHFGSMRDFDTTYANIADALIITDAQASVNPQATNIPNTKVLNIAIKDYSPYKTTALGDKIYIYKGINGDKDKYYNDGMIDAIEDAGFKTISAHNVSNEYLRRKIYPQCFCFIKRNVTGGNTTKWELGLMGRPTFHNFSIDTIAHTHIDTEEVRWQTLTALTFSDDWLNLDHWG